MDPIREWKALHAGHEIRVLLRWWLRTELYVDGQFQDARTLLVKSRGIPLLTGRMPTAPPGGALIHVYPGALWSHALEIRIGTRRIRLTSPLNVAGIARKILQKNPR